jgi:beta-glucanase (GH16 family)
MNHNQTNTDVLFFDDFSLGELDRTKWNVRVTGKIYNDEQQAYVDSPETIYIAPNEDDPGLKNGCLVIHPRHRPGFVTPEGERFDFISGRIDTRGKFDFSYGTAAARIRLPSGKGVWPAFWLMGHGAWPDIGEIDIMEYVGEPDWISAALHGPGYSGEAGLVNKFFFPTAEDATTWHVYALDWTPDKLIFRVDGATIYRVTRPMTAFFGPWVFDNNKYLILNFALGGTYPYKTNGIEMPYYGLPETTVQRIKDNQVKIMVDWVKVSRYGGGRGIDEQKNR